MEAERIGGMRMDDDDAIGGMIATSLSLSSDI